MKPVTKQVIVLTTLIAGKKQYVAGGISKHGFNNHWLINHTTDVKGLAKEFDSTQEAEDFIPTIHNPHERRYEVVTETLEFKSKKEINEYQRIA